MSEMVKKIPEEAGYYWMEGPQYTLQVVRLGEEDTRKYRPKDGYKGLHLFMEPTGEFAGGGYLLNDTFFKGCFFSERILTPKEMKEQEEARALDAWGDALDRGD